MVTRKLLRGGITQEAEAYKLNALKNPVHLKERGWVSMARLPAD